MTENSSLQSIHFDEPLQVGDRLETGDVLGRSGVCVVVELVGQDVYKIRHQNGAIDYIRHAKHWKGIKNGIFVYVKKNSRERWVRDGIGPAEYWACNPKRCE